MPPPEVLSNSSTAPSGELTITASGFGPISARTPATLGALRKLLVGYDVRPVNDGSLEYDVFAGTERLLFVVPNDDGSVFNVHATSQRIGVRDRDWRVGAKFRGTVSACECWGANPTCYQKGEHVAVNLARDCGDDLTNGEPVINGAVIQRVIWSPRAFGGSFGGDGYGGAGYGGGDDPCD